MERRHRRNTPRIPLVALIDGDADTCDMYAVGLSSLGFETRVIAGDADAYSHIWALHPDIVVMEIALPHTDGLQLLHMFREHPRTRNIPVVVLTGAAGPSARARAEEAHCAEFIVKPRLPEHLADDLRRVIVDAVS